jgi:hypothetical protein
MTTVSPLRSGAAVGALAAFTQYLRELQAKAQAAAVGDVSATEAPSLAVTPSTASSQVSADAVTAAPALPSWQGPGASTEQRGSSAGSGWPQAYGVGTQSGVGSVIDLLS